MKKITFCLLALGCSLGAFAQTVVFTPVESPAAPQTKSITADKTLKPPSSGLACFNQVVVVNLMLDSVNVGYAAGTNSFRYSKYAQIYKLSSGTGTCTGVVAKIGAGKAGDGDFKAEIFSVSAGKPAASLGVSDPVDATIVTNPVTNPQDVAFTFSSPVAINSDFAAAIEIPDYFEDPTTRIVCMIQSTPQNCVWGTYDNLSCVYNPSTTQGGWKVMKDSYTSGQEKARMDLHIYPVFNDTDNIRTSIEEGNPLALTASVYPNPANDVVTVVSLNKVEKLEIYNTMGQVVYAESTNNLISKIDINGLSAGNYIIKMQTEKGLVSKKLVINK